MSQEISMRPIAHIRTDFPEKFGIPRQSGLVKDLTARVVMEPEFANPDAFRGLEEFSHIWLLWLFSESGENTWSPTVRPPRLGGNVRKGVFASRSPFRPNRIGLSCVQLKEIRMESGLGPVLIVQGADLMDGTPILDIKPYHAGADCHPEATAGFTSENVDYRVKVIFPEGLLARIPADKRESLKGVLSEDPRPAFHHDPERVYGMSFGKHEIHFRVRDKVLTVVSVENRENR